MTVAAFDTLKFARALREKASLSPEQAEGFADAIAEAIQSDLVTKTDLNASSAALQGAVAEARREMREGYQQLDGKIRESELRLEAKIEATKAELIKWMFGTVGFQTIIIIGAVIALAKSLHP